MTPFWESSDFTEALVVKGLLEHAGFAVHMDNFNMASVLPHVTFAGGYRLWVPDEDVQAAERVIAEARAQAEAADPVDEG
ncbi:putative signal transducing protein [Kordiimonas marina]|uniref:putative signal transducing protein n=1 Tax=Kordiimonas marina TaxID=2872312 RepID=UPI001FF64FC8|nr:DUF2007 domain-containing protein [Kordiimonas marina]MCJ9429710.1 DUF2007 domain-containing protein [Kordiimonas marina]